MTTTTPTPALADLDLPPLPEPYACLMKLQGGYETVFTAEQYRQGQRDAIAASRRAAETCEHCNTERPLHLLNCPVAVKGMAEGKKKEAREPLRQLLIDLSNNTYFCGLHLSDDAKYAGYMRDAEAAEQGIIELFEKIATPAPASAGQAVSAQRIREIGAGVYGFPIKSDDMQFAQELLKEAGVTAPASAGQAAPSLPEGWVPLSIVYNQDSEHPEEVAYGPPHMMARLGKWLDKFIEREIAERAAQPAEGAGQAEASQAGRQYQRKVDEKIIARRDAEIASLRAGQAGQVADAWHDAVFTECMKIETAYKADDPAGTVRALIHWYYEEASSVSDGVKRLADNYMRLTCATERAAAPADLRQIEWGNDLQGRLIDLSQDMTESEDARQVMAEAACLLASLTGHAVSQ